MNNYVIKDNDTLVIDKNGEYNISGTGNLSIKVLDNINAKVLFKELRANLIIDLDSYSTLEIVQINYDENKNSKVFNLNEQSNLVYKYLSVAKSEEDLKINLNGYKASSTVEYLIINKNQKSYFPCLITHNAKETSSKINNIGIALDSSNIWFDTVSKINKGMAKSQAEQLARGILIGKDSVITSQPILKIDEFDVKANHGTAIGRMSDDELFYLMSRGVSRQDAYKLILFGLINPVIKSVFDLESSEKFAETVTNLV